MKNQKSPAKPVAKGSKGNPPQKKTNASRSAGRDLQSRPEITKPVINPRYYAYIITGVFFIIALIGILHHEMWRDEHQAWLVARDAASLPQLFQNMRYEGNPALWHLLLFFITRFTHNPVYMQYLHLAIACGFIFVFNRYSEIAIPYKILFTFSYFALYEYTIISRSYGLGLLLIFTACALYKNRTKYYLLIGLTLALLCNVTIYGVVVALVMGGLLLLDYIFYQTKNQKTLIKLLAGGGILIIGLILAIIQIMPDKNNSFPAIYAKELFDGIRWASTSNRLFTTYFYLPRIQDHYFWNNNIYFIDYPTIHLPFWKWLTDNTSYLWAWIYLPILTLVLSILIFLRKPMILFLYTGGTVGLLSVYYYTDLIHYRYTGYLLIVLIICYWLSRFYSDVDYKNKLLRFFATVGKRIQMPFLALVLGVNVIGGLVAYSKDYSEKFTPSKDAADYIKANKLDTLPMVGFTDFAISPIASYLDTKIYYPQMKDFGSYCVWSKQRANELKAMDIMKTLNNIVDTSKSKKCLLILTHRQTASKDGGKTFDVIEHALIRKDVKMDLIKFFDQGIVSEEEYSLYIAQKIDPEKENVSGYIILQ